MRECSTVVNGLRFYTPDIINGKALTAYEWLESSGHTAVLGVVERPLDGVYALTPDGEHLLTDLDVGGLQKVEDDLKRARSQRN